MSDKRKFVLVTVDEKWHPIKSIDFGVTANATSTELEDYKYSIHPVFLLSDIIFRQIRPDSREYTVLYKVKP